MLIRGEGISHLQNFLRHLIDVAGVGAEGIDEIGEESEEQREGASVDDGAGRADCHQSVVQPVGEAEEVAEGDGGRVVFCGGGG